MPKLTMHFIKTKVVQPDNGSVAFYRDDDLTGFGLKVTRGSMTYFVEGRVNGRTRRVSLGRHGVLTPDEARSRALVILAGMSSGVVPKLEKEKSKTTSITNAMAQQRFSQP